MSEEYTGNSQFEGRSGTNQMNHASMMKSREYVESSHRSVLARSTGNAGLDRSHHAFRSPSSQSSECRQPRTPVPSLVGSDTMSLQSANTLSPTTPVFDTMAHPSSTTVSSHQENLRLPDSIRFQPQPNMSRSVQPVLHPDFDPASTYQPRRITTTNPSLHSTQQSPTSASPDETSFIDWDDDSSRIQRVKQSLNVFQRPHRTNNTNQGAAKNPDKYLNAIPRIPLITNSNSKQEARSCTPQLQTKPSTIPVLQRQSPPTRTPASFDRPRRPPVPSTRIAQSPAIRYSEDARLRPAYSIVPQRQPQQRVSLSIDTRTRDLPPTSIYSSQPMKSPGLLSRKLSNHRDGTNRPKIRHHDELVQPSTPVDSEIPVPQQGKSKRFMNMMHGAIERASMRDLRKEARSGK